MMIYNLSTTKEMKQQLEPEFRTWMTNTGSTPPNPAWFINAEFVLTKLDKRGLPLKLGGGSGAVLLSHLLDAGVAKKEFHQKEHFDPREVEVCFQLRHPNVIRLLGASAAVSDLPPALYFELADGPSLRRVFSTAMAVPGELKMKIS